MGKNMKYKLIEQTLGLIIPFWENCSVGPIPDKFILPQIFIGILLLCWINWHFGKLRIYKQLQLKCISEIKPANV